MKRGFLIGLGCLVAIALLVIGLFVYPTYRLKAGLDDLAAHMPPGQTFVYGSAHYSIFSHTVILENASWHFQPSGIILDIDKVVVKHGNAKLAAAINAASADPDIDDATLTPLAGKVIFDNVHSILSPVDISIAHAEIDGLKIDLREILAKLPAETSPGGSTSDAILQRAGLYASGATYDHLKLDNAVASGKDEEGSAATMKISSLSIDGFDRGDAGDTHLTGLELDAAGFVATVDSIVAGAAKHRPFWVALRDGAPIDVAAEQFQGASQTVDGATLSQDGKKMGSLQELQFSNLGYHAGALTSLQLGLKGLAIYPDAAPVPPPLDVLPKLGYQPIMLDGSLSFVWDQNAGAIRFDPVTLTLEQGGTLTLGVALAGATMDAEMSVLKLASLNARYDDASLFGKWLAFQGSQNGTSAKEARKADLATIEKMKMRFKGDPASVDALSQAELFVANPREIVVTLKPSIPLGLQDLDPGHPQALGKKLGLKVMVP
jgi:hypothetical protein